MERSTLSYLESALMQAQQADNLHQQGVLAREIATLYHEHASLKLVADSTDAAYNLFKQAVRYFDISITCFIESADIAHLYLSMGLKGAAQFDSGQSQLGITKLHESIGVLNNQGAEAFELDLIVLLMLRRRPESWVYLRRARYLTRKDSTNASRRWEVIMAAIGNDLYDWLKERRARAA